TYPRAYFPLFFQYTPTTEIYTLSLHDALPISPRPRLERLAFRFPCRPFGQRSQGKWDFVGSPELQTAIAPLSFDTTKEHSRDGQDRKSTRLNSSHVAISYAVFCLKKKKRSFDG